MMENSYEVAVALVAGAACTLLFYRLVRCYFPITVNCWFCNSNTKVPFGNRNCWDCPNCEQYNGFTKSGDYNKAIPLQYVEELNHVAGLGTSQNDIWENGLCVRCNENEHYKLHLLQNFTPTRQDCYDDEVEQFRTHLERRYRLCTSCEEVRANTIKKQNLWLEENLANWKKNDRCHPVKKSLKNLTGFQYRSWILRILQSAVLSISFLLLLSSSFLLKFEFPEELSFLEMFKSLETSFLLSQGYGFAAFSAVGLVFDIAISIISRRTCLSLYCLLRYALWILMQIAACFSLNKSDIVTTLIMVQVSILNMMLQTLQISGVPVYKPRKSICVLKNKDLTPLVNSAVPVSNQSLSGNTSLSEQSMDQSKCANSRTLQQLSDVNSLQTNLSNLNLNSAQQQLVLRDLRAEEFTKKPLLKPARLLSLPRSVTHTSWVAGGFWQDHVKTSPYSNLARNGMNFPQQRLLGFHSQPNSRQPSLCGDNDQFSVFSEPTGYRNKFNYANWHPVSFLQTSTPTSSVSPDGRESPHDGSGSPFTASSLPHTPQFNGYAFRSPENICDPGYSRVSSETSTATALNINNTTSVPLKPTFLSIFMGISIVTNLATLLYLIIHTDSHNTLKLYANHGLHFLYEHLGW